MFPEVYLINEALKKITENSKVIFIDLTDIYIKENNLKYELYKKEGKFLHLNNAGNELFIQKINNVFKNNGSIFLKLNQVFWNTSLTQRRR